MYRFPDFTPCTYVILFHIWFINTIYSRNSTTNSIFPQIIKDTKAEFNHDVISLRGYLMQSKSNITENFDEEYIDDSKTKCECRHTIQLNEEIILSESDMLEASPDIAINTAIKCSPLSVDVKDTIIQSQDKIDLKKTHSHTNTTLKSNDNFEFRSRNHMIRKKIEDVGMESRFILPRKIVTDVDTIYQCYNMDFDESIGGQHIPPSRGTLIFHDIEMSCNREHDYQTFFKLDVENISKFVSERRSLYFENDSIEKDLAIACDDYSAKALNDFKPNNSLAETSNAKLVTDNTKANNDIIECNMERHNDCSISNNVETIDYLNDVIITDGDTKNIENFDVKFFNQSDILKTKHSQCLRNSEYNKIINPIYCHYDIQCNEDLNVTKFPISQSPVSPSLCISHPNRSAIAKPSRNTIYFLDENIDFDLCTENNKETLHNVYTKEHTSPPILYSHDKNFINPINKLSKNDQHSICDDTNSIYLKPQHLKKTILLAHDMDIDNVDQTSNESILQCHQKTTSNEEDRESTHGNSTRRTLYFNKGILETEHEAQNIGIEKTSDFLHIPSPMKNTLYDNDEIQKINNDALNPKNISGNSKKLNLKNVHLEENIENYFGQKTNYFDENEQHAHFTCEDYLLQKEEKHPKESIAGFKVSTNFILWLKTNI